MEIKNVWIIIFSVHNFSRKCNILSLQNREMERAGWRAASPMICQSCYHFFPPFWCINYDIVLKTAAHHIYLCAILILIPKKRLYVFFLFLARQQLFVFGYTMKSETNCLIDVLYYAKGWGGELWGKKRIRLSTKIEGNQSVFHKL